MGYKRFIAYGRNVELYEYEKDFIPFTGQKRRVERKPVLYGVAESGSVAFSVEQERLGKRKDNAQRASMAFRRLVLANLAGVENPLLLTLTYAENFKDLRGGYCDFHSFMQVLRRRYGKVFKYIAVPEFQVRGAVHFHSLLWGLRFDQIGKLIPFSQVGIRNLIDTPFWKHGFAFLKETDGHEKLSSYLVKYMAKAFISAELHNQKAYVSSRNCSRPVSVGGVVDIDYLLDEYVGVSPVPYEQKSYETTRLGLCKRSLFYNNPDIPIVSTDLSTVSLVPNEDIFVDW
jgi:hypothetical protein